MYLSNRVLAAFFAASTVIQTCLAQVSAPTAYTDPGTGITFDTWTMPATGTTGGLTFGMALPSDALTTDATEFIGYLQCASTKATESGWCGLSFKGSMNGNLLLMAWPYNGTILTSFRWSSGYSMPDVYAGNATLTQISSTINATHYTLLFRCQDCLAWNHKGTTGAASTKSGQLVLGWAEANASPGNPSCPAKITLAQHDSQSIWAAKLDKNAVSTKYEEWTKLATKTVPGDCGGDDGGGSAPKPVPVPEGAEYDYVVVGSGAGGIVMADRLSRAGHKVLLIEKGPPSSGRWGGTMRPEWLDGTNLTRFDVPGLCNQIWHDSAGIACKDTDQMAGCVLGGGTAVNAALWWRPNPIDWDYVFPAGWHSRDMIDATNHVFNRIPWTVHPSEDGRIYLQQGYDVLAGGLRAGGWHEVTLNDNASMKNHTFGHTPYMFMHGERGGPMATYLVSASARDNFDLWTNTTVKRVVRTAEGHVTGVEVEAFIDGGYEGVVNVTAKGRVILSAGTFGTPKILLRSGIGPSDQLKIVKGSSDGSTMIAEAAWINLPVGENLVDHTNTDTVATHPDVVFYDFYAAWDSPIESDKSSYLNSRTGILTQSAPNIGPIMFDEIVGADGIKRQIQWTARMEGGHDIPDKHAITMSQYLGRGSTSRGRMTITGNLDTVVSTLPYLRDQHDVDAVIQGLINLQVALKNVKGLTWAYPAPNVTAAQFVKTMEITASTRRANHWMGTCKMGTDDGRDGGTAVVDLNTKVYGTDNLFVVDGSIFPGMVTSNPSAYILTVAERAADRILALK
ncbi:cellobiose dehydrogenase [Aspergillus clavatus NRRL 1]|uniref:Cellobiose dehydrogenase n=1 Tax=Aspergillus clavatus (strain ATCC 1007 / CBS 513.65 / DSM 816 / NCTC 3887 / NRRL 1 / QM 1276 / 107) TaxID=344612 RepID=A1C890_ASPCL|nr:cellobiose dehydrogenase [Aspergillus clavatus NRRL 1]EAW14611.1 cellobiose dehydrogenase [Aspergillus clavatus NRRL 1]